MGRYVWVPGYYKVSRPNHVYVRAHWVRVGHQWVFSPGHWAPISQPQIPPPMLGMPPPSTLVVQSSPPPMMTEVVPVAPSVHHEWVGGHWTWNGARWVWVPGDFLMRRLGFVWQRPLWMQHGPNWRYVPGYWRRM